MAKFQPPRGTRDFLPEEMVRRQFVFDTLRKVFEKFGYSPLQTPAFESWELLSAKGSGGEAIKEEIYYFRDKSDRELGLRFDLTAPMSRVLANNPELPKPFKRYQMGPVWRYEEVKSGRRYREFWQCDVDVAGTGSMEAEAEVLAIAIAGLEALGFKNVYIKVNNRKVLEGLVEISGAKGGEFLPVCRALDKIEKFGIKKVEEELAEAGLNRKAIKKLLKITDIKGSNKAVLTTLKKELKGVYQDGVEEMERILELTKTYGIEKKIVIDPCLARGLDYYTGPIFEARIKGREDLGTVVGGGRYDKLIQLYGGPITPATGLSFGVERIAEAMKERDMPKTAIKVFVISVNKSVRKETLKIATKLREEGINTGVDLMARSISKQLDFANKAGIPWVLIIGERELKEKKFTLRDMESGKERKVSLQQTLRIFCK